MEFLKVDTSIAWYLESIVTDTWDGHFFRPQVGLDCTHLPSMTSIARTLGRRGHDRREQDKESKGPNRRIDVTAIAKVLMILLTSISRKFFSMHPTTAQPLTDATPGNPACTARLCIVNLFLYNNVPLMMIRAGPTPMTSRSHCSSSVTGENFSRQTLIPASNQACRSLVPRTRPVEKNAPHARTLVAWYGRGEECSVAEDIWKSRKWWPWLMAFASPAMPCGPTLHPACNVLGLRSTVRDILVGFLEHRISIIEKADITHHRTDGNTSSQSGTQRFPNLRQADIPRTENPWPKVGYVDFWALKIWTWSRSSHVARTNSLR